MRQSFAFRVSESPIFRANLLLVSGKVFLAIKNRNRVAGGQIVRSLKLSQKKNPRLTTVNPESPNDLKWMDVYYIIDMSESAKEYIEVV